MGAGAEVREILAYHEATKHSPESIRRSRWMMDWSNKPDPFRRYVGLPEVPLEREATTADRAALDSISGIATRSAVAEIDRRAIARLLTWGAGLHHRVRYPEGETFFFRACAGEPDTARAPAVLAMTGIPWRTAWKYAERGYRHLFWDAGMIVANMLALETSVDVPVRVVLGFADREVEFLLGLDGRREFPLCLLPIGRSRQKIAPASNPPEALELRTRPLSRTEYEFQAITAANEVGRLDPAEKVERWRARAAEPGRTEEPRGPGGVADSVEDVLRRRGSARRFGTAPMPAEILVDVLERATGGVPTDHAPDGSHRIEPYLVVNRVEGLERGAYVWGNGELRLLREGDYRVDASFLCLDQRLGGTSAATMFLMTDLAATLERLGARGYRSAQLEAGIVAGKVYLGAYAHRFGATGLTFYDDEVERFFSPDADGKSCMLVVTVGDSPRLN